MKTETDRIAASMQQVLSGAPWYGDAVLQLLGRVDQQKVYIKPNAHAHSMIELLYHMITWSEFTQERLEKDPHTNPHVTEALNWRETNPEDHTWNNGVARLTASINKTIATLQAFTDDMLEDKVDFREYNFRFLLNGIIQHHIYHLAQIAYINTLLR